MPRRSELRYSPAVHEPPLAREARRGGGVYYTPPEIARQLAELTIRPLLPESPPDSLLNVLDPACGAGELLIAARQAISSSRCQAALHGLDIDQQAVANCRRRLPDSDALQVRIWHGDALATESPFPAGNFDVVLANPPYVSIRELARQRSPDEVAALRKRFRTARGNFDLYVLFIERCLAWLRPGGRCGLIVPNKWATLDYARPCRELLQELATLDCVVDLSAERVFREASVYPHLLVFTKRSADDHRITSPDTIVLGGSLSVESQVSTQPLGSLARLSCGTPGYVAAKIGALLAEAGAAPSPALPFVTSGNIDRYKIRTGNVRYLRRLWRDPRLAIGAEGLTQRQRQLFTSPKLVIAGLTRRLEAAWDAHGLALGVQVFAATEFQHDPYYLLALLNSKLLSYLFRTRFAAKRLGGGYLAVNKGQLVRLPITVPTDKQKLKRLATLAAAMSSGRVDPSVDAELDRLVYSLYQLSAAQVAMVENDFQTLAAERAA